MAVDTVAVDSAVEAVFEDEEAQEEDFALRDTEEVFVDGAVEPGVEVEVEEEEVFAEDVVAEEEELLGLYNDGQKTPIQSSLTP